MRPITASFNVCGLQSSMSSLGSLKSIALSSWKLILAFILGAVVHGLYQEWASKNDFSLGKTLGLIKPVKPVKHQKRPATPEPDLDLEPFDEYDTSSADLNSVPATGIVSLDD